MQHITLEKICAVFFAVRKNGIRQFLCDAFALKGRKMIPAKDLAVIIKESSISAFCFALSALIFEQAIPFSQGFALG